MRLHTTSVRLKTPAVCQSVTLSISHAVALQSHRHPHPLPATIVVVLTRPCLDTHRGCEPTSHSAIFFQSSAHAHKLAHTRDSLSFSLRLSLPHTTMARFAPLSSLLLLVVATLALHPQDASAAPAAAAAVATPNATAAHSTAVNDGSRANTNATVSRAPHTTPPRHGNHTNANTTTTTKTIAPTHEPTSHRNRNATRSPLLSSTSSTRNDTATPRTPTLKPSTAPAPTKTKQSGAIAIVSSSAVVLTAVVATTTTVGFTMF
ncbi:hypothetical protein PINS_up006022 [Pythium insidiosum]|nr:hypothetical protein PINS_up006022 [Pythium insidiosum]